jgi:GNAT superfamily N-acetyltransferase
VTTFAEISPSDHRLDDVMALLRQLRDQHSSQELAELYAQGHADSGYRMAALFDDDGDCVAVAGYRLQTSAAHGRYLYVDDLVTTSGQRSRGHGSALVEHLRHLAFDQDCESIQLDSAVWREDAHRFYEREGFRRSSVRFVLDLK